MCEHSRPVAVGGGEDREEQAGVFPARVSRGPNPPVAEPFVRPSRGEDAGLLCVPEASVHRV